MTPEDEEFQRISREIRRNAAEDDDIQDYKRVWVGLSEQDINELKFNLPDLYYWIDVIRATEKRLKDKNAWTPFTKTLWKPFTLIFGQHPK